MANVLYPLAKKAFQNGAIDLLSVNVKAVLVDGADYTYDAAHQFLSDVAAGGRVATSGNLTGKTLGANGNFDSNNPTFTAVSGDIFEIIILYVDTGVAGTSRLLAYYETADGLPGTPVGTDFIIHIDSTGWWTL